MEICGPATPGVLPMARYVQGNVAPFLATARSTLCVAPRPRGEGNLVSRYGLSVGDVNTRATAVSGLPHGSDFAMAAGAAPRLAAARCISRPAGEGFLVDLTRRQAPSPSSPPLLRCSSVHSPEMEERHTTKKRSNEEWEALKLHMFHPLVRNLTKICSTRRAFDLEDYQIGMLSGAFLGCVGCYQLWKTAPSTFVDVALAFLFYKLSIVSSELHQHRKSNSLTTRLKFGTILVMVLKDIKKSYVLLDAVRMPVFLLYICAFLFDVAGVKKDGRRALVSLVNLLKMRGGIQEVWRIMWFPGYVSPYVDGTEWSDVRA